MIIESRRPDMRHGSRTHRVELDRLIELTHLDSNISIRYVHTKEQIADILTKGSLSPLLSGMT